MKLLLRQRMFSWFDSYDIYDESGKTVYQVKGELAWGHQFRVYDMTGREVAGLKQVIFTFLPRFEIYLNGNFEGYVSRRFTLFFPQYDIDYKGWTVEGSPMEWNYAVLGADGGLVASIGKQLFNWTDTYVMDIPKAENALSVLMFVLAIDAEKCSRSSD